MIIDDLSAPHPMARCGAAWRLSTDQVMGGVSSGTLTRETVAGRTALRMRGTVRLENNGGFVQAGIDLQADGRSIDVSGFTGLTLDVYGNGETYGIHVRTDDTVRPWQSYRQSFMALPAWRTIRLPFTGFTPHRVDAALDLTRIRRIGLAAIGSAFEADVALGRLVLDTAPS